MEVMWERFASEEKCVMLVKSNEVTLTQQLAQNSILLKLQTIMDFNKEYFKSTLCQLWRGSQGVIIK